ncbi:MAG: metallophosphoesterase, partial [Vicinamibacterales bacterium]
GVDRIVVGGDVAPGPMTRESLERLMGLDVPVDFLLGNGDAAVLAAAGGRDPGPMPDEAKAAVRWTAASLDAAHLEAIAAWPATVRLHVPPLGDVLFCHATPRDHTEIFTRVTDEARLTPIFAPAAAAIVVCGHTHMAFDRMIGATRVVNAGSAGMRFGGTGADWLLLGPSVELRHVAYDLPAAASLITATAYPGAADFAARFVLDSPAEAAMLEAYRRAELA